MLKPSQLPWSAPLALLFSFAFIFGDAHAQFNLEGDASNEGGGCYRLTEDDDNEIGAAWSIEPMDLNEPFDVVCTIYLGDSNNNGGDGMAWVIRNEDSNDLQPNQMPGPDGQYMGYGDIDESVVVEIDTDNNNSANDPGWDHLAVMRDGEPDHDDPTCLFDAVPCLPNFANVEDDEDHTFRVTWDPATDSLKVYFDCLLRIATTVDIPTIIGDSEGIWGFVACTEGEENEHRFCEAELQEPEEVMLDDVALCPGESVTVTLPDGLVDVSWSPSSGLSSTTGSEVEVSPAATTAYTVTWEDACGNPVTATFNVEVAELGIDVPLAGLTLCDGAPLDLPPVFPPPGYALGWEAADGALPATIDVPGDYSLFITTPEACVFEALIAVGNIDLPDLDLGPDVALCPGESIEFDTGIPNTVWHDNSFGSLYIATTTETVEATIGSGACTATDAVEVVEVADFEPDVWQGSWVLCGADGEVTLDANDATWPAGVSYDWGGGAQGATLTVDAPGTYSVEVQAGGCTSVWMTAVEEAAIVAVDLGDDLAVCPGESVTLDAGYPAAWTFWVLDQIPQGFSATFTPPTSGTVEVTVSNGDCSIEDSIEINVVPDYTPTSWQDVTLCAGESVTLDATDAGWSGDAPSYDWDGGPEVATWSVDAAGTYAVTITAGGCEQELAVDVAVSSVEPIGLGGDVEICAGEDVVLFVDYPDGWVDWFLDDALVASNAAIFVADTEGTVTCEVSDGVCVATDGLEVTQLPAFDAQLPLSVSFCEGETATVNAAPGASSYVWSDNGAGSTVVVDAPGVIQVTTTYLGCEATASFTAVEVPLPVIDLGPDFGVCEGEPVVLQADVPDADWIQWNGLQFGETFNVYGPGTIVVEVSANGCSNTDEITVDFYPSPEFDLGPDQHHCFGQAVVLEAQDLPSNSEVTWWPNNVQANPIVVNSTATYVAQASLGGCVYTDSISVAFAAPYSPGLPESFELCLGQTSVLTAEPADPLFTSWYAWEPVGNGLSVEVDHEGTYVFSAGNACGTWIQTVQVSVEDCDCSVFVPSAFTPNNDGRNDRFMPQMSCQPIDYSFELLDRWGVRFFYTEDPSEGWIGEVPDGETDDRPFFGQQDLYIYRVVTVFETNGVARHQVHTGQVLLLR